MSDAIDFLERLGQDSTLRYATPLEIDRAMSEADLSPAIRAAVLSGAQRPTEVALDAVPNVCCGILVPEGDWVDD